jgi:hypothetical protein
MSKWEDRDAGFRDGLVARACAGDAAAWRELSALLWPVWERLARSSLEMRSLGRSNDHTDNVVVNLFEKLWRLDKDGHRKLASYPPWQERQENRDKTFEDWNRIVTANAVRDYVREQVGRDAAARQPDRTMPSVKRLLNEFASSSPLETPTSSADVEKLSMRPAVTREQTARELLDHARDHLPEDQYRALALWLHDESFERIEAALALDAPGAGHALVRAAVAVLRRRFGEVATFG